MNYREMQEKQARLKKLEAEQRERDRELAGGGPALIKRKGLKKKAKKKQLGLGQGVHEGSHFAQGELKVSRKTIEKVASTKRKKKL